MKISQMRIRLCEKYPNDAWAKKVQKMSDSQVIAIYKRLSESGTLDGVKKPFYVPAPPGPTVYYCRKCLGTFAADSPCLHECRFCGSQLLTKEAPEVLIKKEKKQ